MNQNLFYVLLFVISWAVPVAAFADDTYPFQECADLKKQVDSLRGHMDSTEQSYDYALAMYNSIEVLDYIIQAPSLPPGVGQFIDNQLTYPAGVAEDARLFAKDFSDEYKAAYKAYRDKCEL